MRYEMRKIILRSPDRSFLSGVLICRSETQHLVEVPTVVAAVVSVGFSLWSFSHFSGALPRSIFELAQRSGRPAIGTR